MQQKQPMNQAQRRMLVFSLLIVALAALLFILFTNPGGDAPPTPQATRTPEPTFATVSEALDTLPTPTPPPTLPPTATPAPTATPTPSPAPAPASITVLRKGSKGAEVVALQAKLIELGYLQAGSNDGDFGSGTEAAVKAFQKNNGLKEDGVAGQETQTRLYSPEAVRAR